MRWMLATVLAAFLAPVTGHAQWGISAAGAAHMVEHRVDAGYGVAQNSGTLMGGGGALGIGQWIEIAGAAASGTLTADSALAEDLDVVRGEAWAIMHALPWLSVRAGAVLQSLKTEIASQRWTTARIGAEARTPMLDGRFQAIGRFDLIPVAKVTGAGDADRAFAAAAAIGWEGGLLNAEVGYSLERYDFPEKDGLTRREQFGLVSARFGVRFGRRAVGGQ